MEIPTEPIPQEHKKTFFVTHIGQVEVNNVGCVIFEANSQTPVGLVVREGQPAKFIGHVETLRRVIEGVNEAIEEMKNEGTWNGFD